MNSKLTCLLKLMIERDLQALRCHVLQRPASFLLAHPDHGFSDQEQLDFDALKLRYKKGEPLAYLLGSKGFWKHDFKVSPAVLIPRPETELLLELALEKIPAGAQVLELGTGSGCLAISFALERPDCDLVAVDLSQDALELAKKNANTLGVRLDFIQSNWFENVMPKKFQAILSNPPYIEVGDVHLQALSFEPELALVSGPSGLDAIQIIIKQARDFLNPDGLLALEHGYHQEQAVQALFQAAGYRHIETRLDLQGHPRVTWGLL